MYSSDMAENIPVELMKYRTITRDEKTLEQILSGTAREVFGCNLIFIIKNT